MEILNAFTILKYMNIKYHYVLYLRENDFVIYNLYPFGIFHQDYLENGIKKISHHFFKKNFIVIHDIPSQQIYEIKKIPEELNFFDKIQWKKSKIVKKCLFKYMNLDRKLIMFISIYQNTLHSSLIESLISAKASIMGFFTSSMIENEMLNEFIKNNSSFNKKINQKQSKWKLFIISASQYNTKHILSMEEKLYMHREFNTIADRAVFRDFITESDMEEMLKFAVQEIPDFDKDITDKDDMAIFHVTKEKQSQNDIEIANIIDFFSFRQCANYEEIIVEYIYNFGNKINFHNMTKFLLNRFILISPIFVIIVIFLFSFMLLYASINLSSDFSKLEEQIYNIKQKKSLESGRMQISIVKGEMIMQFINAIANNGLSVEGFFELVSLLQNNLPKDVMINNLKMSEEKRSEVSKPKKRGFLIEFDVFCDENKFFIIQSALGEKYAKEIKYSVKDKLISVELTVDFH